jgi:hypothetical protein
MNTQFVYSRVIEKTNKQKQKLSPVLQKRRNGFHGLTRAFIRYWVGSGYVEICQCNIEILNEFVYVSEIDIDTLWIKVWCDEYHIGEIDKIINSLNESCSIYSHILKFDKNFLFSIAFNRALRHSTITSSQIVVTVCISKVQMKRTINQ